MKFEAEIDKKDLKRWNDSIDSLFNDIRYNVSSPAEYRVVVEKTKRGIKENKLALKNSSGWEKVKNKLKSDGKINFKEPLNVTGQLADDFYAKIWATNPKDLEKIGVEMTFKDEPRVRPTIKSMYGVYKDPTAVFEYQMISSLAVAKKLELYTGTLNGVNYNISEAIYKLYADDYEKIVFAAVAKAFIRNK